MRLLVIRPLLLFLFLHLGMGSMILAQEMNFTSHLPDSSGIDFENILTEDSILNIFYYLNTYAGGGVGIGDINKDGLQDLFFVGSQVSNKLYLNKGAFTFEDITPGSGVQGKEGQWSSGVTMVDINADGWLDIYVCKAGPYKDKNMLKNELYINNGNLTFTEKAAEYGIADNGRSVHAAFFDYDNDNDLDLFVVNHPEFFKLPYEQRIQNERSPNPIETDRLYRNDNGRYTDVTQSAGVQNWAFGLAVITADLNGDGWTDMYVSCDYDEPDYYWINQGNGTFVSGLQQSFLHTSNFSMGADAGDINNDGHLDFAVVDMMAKDNRRKKTNMSGMNPAAFWNNVMNGRHFQYMQNTLQLNNGNGTFSEIAELAEVDNTDWSWAPILADFDNDGWQDLFVSNGMRRDVRNNDYGKKWSGKPLGEVMKNWDALLEKMPSEKISNYCFKNNGDLSFSDVSAHWNLNQKGFSTGAAVGDLDNDGDLDLVMNNIDEAPFLLENNSRQKTSLRIIPIGPASNPYGIGLKAKLKYRGGEQIQQLQASRGFISSSEPVLHFGYDKDNPPYSLELTWTDGRNQTIFSPTKKRVILALYEESSDAPQLSSQSIPFLSELTTAPPFIHKEQGFDDYAEQVLLPHRYSHNGPMAAVGDVNGDDRDDFFIGGAKGQAGSLLLQQEEGRFSPSPSSPWNAYASREAIGAEFFDADGDKDLDLYVVSGSNEWPEGDSHYQDCLYLNDGEGNFSDGSDLLPELTFSGGRIAVLDDDPTLGRLVFVGGRVVPGNYPAPPKSALLQYKDGKYIDIIHEVAPELKQAGMITDAKWVDIDEDEDKDLVITGEWMPISIFENVGGNFKNITASTGLDKYVGWWYSLEVADLDEDGDMDFVAGNLGTNTKYRASEDAPFEVYGGDVDESGSNDIILGYHQDGTAWPVRGRQCSSEQVPMLEEKFPTYQDFGISSIQDIYGESLNKTQHYKATWMKTSWIENKSNGKFVVHALPNEAQLSTTNGIAILNIIGDSKPELFLAGNMFHAEVETCRHDASIGSMIWKDRTGMFAARPLEDSGFFAHGDVKDLALIHNDGKAIAILVVRNNGPVSIFKIDE